MLRATYAIGLLACVISLDNLGFPLEINTDIPLLETLMGCKQVLQSFRGFKITVKSCGSGRNQARRDECTFHQAPFRERQAAHGSLFRVASAVAVKLKLERGTPGVPSVPLRSPRFLSVIPSVMPLVPLGFPWFPSGRQPPGPPPGVIRGPLCPL